MDLKNASKLAMILAIFKHQQRTITSLAGTTGYFPYHSHRTKTFKQNQRKERKLSRRRAA